MSVDAEKRLRQLEQEYTRLKKLLAERDLEIAVIKEIAAKSASKGCYRAAAPALQRGAPLTPGQHGASGIWPRCPERTPPGGHPQQ